MCGCVKVASEASFPHQVKVKHAHLLAHKDQSSKIERETHSGGRGERVVSIRSKSG